MTIEWDTPLFTHLNAFRRENPASFHVPGHANGEVYEQLANMLDKSSERELITQLAQLSKIDVTELSHTDDLHDPEGVIEQAQVLLSQLYGAEHSFFLVGGSTAGNIALILSLCQPDDIIIVQRNVHKSIINGCKLAGVQVVFVSPMIEEGTGLALVPSLQSIEIALQRYPKAKAVFLSTPNYYGLNVDLEPYAKLIHSYKLPLLVDEAHGAHYGIAPHTPKSSIAVGADAVVQSAHKTLPALTMGAYLHIQGPFIKKQMVQKQLSIIESSSPSYVLMASLDIARAVMQHYGLIWFQETYERLNKLRKWLKDEKLVIEAVEIDNQEQCSQDPYRLLLQDTTGTYSGIQLQKAFEKENIWVEMANESVVVLVCHMNMSDEKLQHLQRVIWHIHQQIISQSAPEKRVSSIINVHQTSVSEPIKMMRYTDHLESELIPLSEASGRVCAEMIIPYPPGIPLLYENERIQEEHLEQIKLYIKLGARMQGQNALTEGFIQVFI